MSKHYVVVKKVTTIEYETYMVTDDNESEAISACREAVAHTAERKPEFIVMEDISHT